MNICLLGDSILDNVTYTDGAPAVTDHLNRLLGGTGRATLIAVDGSVTAQVHRQVRGLPADATHLVLSSGGNDALAHEDLLRQPAKSVSPALTYTTHNSPQWRSPPLVYPAKKGDVPMKQVAGHMDGFEKEGQLQTLFADPEVRSRLHRWSDFLAVAGILRPDLTVGAFVRRPCQRVLRFTGDATRATEFVVGTLYHSQDFNGATYTMAETGTLIGYSHFDLVEPARGH